MNLPIKAGIALGSNLGNREANLQAGFDFLHELSLEGHFLKSSVLSTEPVDCPPGSGSFLNAMVEIEWGEGPEELLGRLKAFEMELGRPRERPVNSPRPLDLDIIYFGELTINRPDLIIPHPRATQREFVLKPLAEIRPTLILPGESVTVLELYEQLRGEDGASRANALL